MQINKYDAVVVGSGFAGSVIARCLADDNKKVLVIERRNHIAGNMYDYTDENGILVQAYGPHSFHTNEKSVYEYIKRFSDVEDYKLKCMVYMNNKFTPSPFNFNTIEDYFSKDYSDCIKENLRLEYGGRSKATIVEMLNCGNNVVKAFAEFLFKNDYSLYTAKQWGISPDEIDVSVLKRVPVVFSYKKDYFDDIFQCMPADGFTKLFCRMLDSDNIDIMLHTDCKEYLSIDCENSKVYFKGKETRIPVIYTGAVDELLDYKYGRLPYRSLRFEYVTKNTNSFQEAPIVAYPQAEGYTRITEYTKLPYQSAEVTKIAIEYPLQYEEGKNMEPYYPIITDKNNALHNSYSMGLEGIDNLFLCGRLADYKYYNMDQVILRAFEVYSDIKKYMNQ